MKKVFAAALVAMLVVVTACGGSSSTGSTGASSTGTTRGSSSTGSTGGSSVTSADRDKFVGTWAGHYGCPDYGVTIEDTLIIKAGSGDLDLSIKIHTTTANPDTVSGTLTSATEVNVPEQSMGGATGTAKISLQGDTLTFEATGLGTTCSGTDYKKA
jgi:hypothetical protein